MFLKKSAAGLLAASIASFATFAYAAPTLVINNGDAIDIQTPPGFSYVANSSGTASELDVTTTSYVFCANIGTGTSLITLMPLRTRWTLPSGNDARIAYNGGRLTVNQGGDTTLGCQVRDAAGQMRTPFSGYGDYLFADSWEDVRSPAQQLAYLANWKPIEGFSWSEPEWPKVPVDSCTWDNELNFPHTDEGSLCAAATGVRPLDVDSQNNPDYGDRAPTMWTKRTSANYIYLARIDTSYDGQHGLPNSHFVSASRPAEADTPSTINVAIRDAFDSGYLSPNATYCFLNKLPAALSDGVCAGPGVYYSGTLPGSDPRGILAVPLPLGVNGVQARSLYIAVVRQKVAGGSSPSNCQPYAAITVIPEQDVARQFAADEFTGDDVVFGFREDEAFDWMGCIN